MNDPYKTLGLSPDADPTSVRQRYLTLVRQFSPDQAPKSLRGSEPHTTTYRTLLNT